MRNNYADKDAEAYFDAKEVDSGADLVVSEAADEDQFWVIDWISVAVRTSDHLTVQFGSRTVWKTEFPSDAGFHHIEFNSPLYGRKGESMTVTVAGGSGKRHLNVRYR